ncbi:hypothetical protein PFISCL1PPCAC_28807 [Pristionchus fissidentatus]|uniref:Uncharacterized protein n=1 Tax=Pristionchus fissidentatus TaxID=1538716 RepID=A0AAV5X358_9BILA|nr:hypothetical protein PFISCL1PPCAC_28807 [Pristionchus fissidentatus]
MNDKRGKIEKNFYSSSSLLLLFSLLSAIFSPNSMAFARFRTRERLTSFSTWRISRNASSSRNHRHQSRTTNFRSRRKCRKDEKRDGEVPQQVRNSDPNSWIQNRERRDDEGCIEGQRVLSHSQDGAD